MEKQLYVILSSQGKFLMRDGNWTWDEEHALKLEQQEAQKKCSEAEQTSGLICLVEESKFCSVD